VPTAKNPNLAEFYVYRLEVDRIPIYVGIGRDKRASDRVRYIKNMQRRDARGQVVKWHLSASVVAYFLRRHHEVCVRYRFSGLVRSAALVRERAEIARLVARGSVLANYQHNPARPSSVAAVVKDWRAKVKIMRNSTM
jgi:hypothetical protein